MRRRRGPGASGLPVAWQAQAVLAGFFHLTGQQFLPMPAVPETALTVPMID
jgi:hypothetical protein